MISRLLLSFALLLAPGSLIGEEEAWQDLMDLDLWESKGKAEWRVEDGVLLGGQDGDPKKSGVLLTKTQYDNFELEFGFMIDEHEKYNSGVYLRHKPGLKGGRGYQINIGRGVAGEPVGLYLNDWLDKGDEDDSIRKPLAWNSLRIRAVGSHVQAWLNDQPIVDHDHEGAWALLLSPGAIALQTYGADGHAGWVKFREIRVKALNHGSPKD